MLGGVERHRNAGGGSDIARPHAAGQDHGVGRDVASRGFDAGRPAALSTNALHLGVFEDPGAALFGALRQRLRRVDGIGLAVLGDEDAADQVVHLEKRPALADLTGRQDMHLEAEHAAHRNSALELLEARFRLGHGYGAILPKSGRLPGLRLERVIKVGRVLGEFGQVTGGAQLPHQAGGMPGRAAGQLPALEQHDVAYAELR